MMIIVKINFVIIDNGDVGVGKPETTEMLSTSLLQTKNKINFYGFQLKEKQNEHLTIITTF